VRALLVLLPVAAIPLACDGTDTPPDATRPVGELLETPVTLSARSRGTSVPVAEVPLRAGTWYHAVVRYRTDPSEKVDNLGVALCDVRFRKGGEPVRLAKAPGLLVAPDGRIYKYLPARGPPDAEQGPAQRLAFSFRAPDGVDSVALALVPWHNKATVVVDSFALRAVPPLAEGSQQAVPARHRLHPDEELFAGFDEPAALVDTPTPLPLSVPPRRTLTLSGRVLSPHVGDRNKALIAVKCFDSDGSFLPPPYPGMTTSPAAGPYVYLPTHDSVNPFRFRLRLPPGASTVELHLRRWASDAAYLLGEDFRVRAEAPTTLKEHLRCAGVTGGEPLPPKQWMQDPQLVDRWLAYWAASPGTPSPRDPAFWLNPADCVERVPAAGHGISVGEGFYKNLAEGRLALCSFRPFTVGSPPDWRADPFGSTGWRQRYQALYWLSQYAAVLPPRRALDGAKRILGSWLAASLWPHAEDHFAWEDHAVAMRLEGLVTLYLGYTSGPRAHSFVNYRTVPPLSPLIDGDRLLKRKIAAQMIVDALLLEEFLYAPSFHAHNHNQFHAHALLLFALAFPNMPQADHWRAESLRRLSELVDELFHPDGVSAEQSTAYHIWVIMASLPEYELIAGMGSVDRSLKEKFRSVLERALIVAVNILTPSGACVQSGDSPAFPRAKEEVTVLVKRFLPHTQSPVLHRFVKDDAPPAGAHLFREGGYLVCRSARPDERMLFVDFSGQLHSHGHYDMGSFCFEGLGNRWVVDPGGPFNYGTYKRSVLVGSGSHNVAAPMGHGQVEGHAAVEQFREADGVRVFSIRTNVYGAGFLHRRVFAVAEDLSAFAVRDDFHSDAACDGYVSSVVLAPTVQAAAKGDGRVILTGAKGATFEVTPFCEPGGTPGVCIGPAEVTPDAGKLVPTKALRFTTPARPPGASSIGYVFAATGADTTQVLRAIKGTPYNGPKLSIFVWPRHGGFGGCRSGLDRV